MTDPNYACNPTNPTPYFRWKWAVDWPLAILLFVPVVVLIATLMVLVRLTSRGPAIYTQVRAGINGRPFTMYKIRTMCHDAEAATGPVWSQPQDPRVTPVGKVLRALHLDELPQLWNVLKGEMSFVGPRPERPEFIGMLAKAIPGYLNRMLVRPGITGLAQVNLPADVDLDGVHCKLMLDCEYINRATLWLDCRIMMYTLFRLADTDDIPSIIDRCLCCEHPRRGCRWRQADEACEESCPVVTSPASADNRLTGSTLEL